MDSFTRDREEQTGRYDRASGVEPIARQDGRKRSGKLIAEFQAALGNNNKIFFATDG
jgi:hypothetical protein